MGTRIAKYGFKISDKILLEAISFLSSNGCQQLTMEALAASLGVSRSTIYRECGDKKTLLNAIMAQQIEELLVNAEYLTREFKSYSQAMTAVICETTQWLRNNVLVMDILSSSQHLDFTDYLLSKDSVFQRQTASILQPIIALGRASGEASTRLSDEEIISWTRSGALLLILTQNMEPVDTQDYVQRFILPTLIAP